MKFLHEIQSKFKTAIISGLVGLLSVVATAFYKDTVQIMTAHDDTFDPELSYNEDKAGQLNAHDNYADWPKAQYWESKVQSGMK